MSDKPTVDKNKLQALRVAMETIEKNFGKGSIMKLGEKGEIGDIPVVPTGSMALDLALGVGGVPRGRVIEIFGPESSGKTTLVMHIMAEAQKLGGTCALIDAEHAFDPQYGQKIGLNVTDLLLSQPDTGEQALEIAETLVRSGAVDVVAVDSVAALVPRAEIEGEMGDAHLGLQARLMSQALRKLTGAISKSNTMVIFTNQIRQKIGVMFGNPETTPGGLALKFYASVRLDIRRIETIKEGETSTGNRVRVKVVKNKVAPPFRTAEFDILFSQGISKEGSLIDVGVELGLIKKSGSWFELKGQKVAQGRAGAVAYLKENTKAAAELEKEIRQSIKKGGATTSAPLVVGAEEEEG